MSNNTILAFIFALLASLVLTPVCRRLAPVLGWVDRPNARKLHLAPMPLLGGLAIYAASVLAIVLFYPSPRGTELLGIVGGATLVLLVGLLDDRGLLHHQVKLMLAMPAAAILLIVSGVHFNIFTSLFASQPLWSIADDILSFVWVVGITASFSIFDHMDGLCAGVVAIASAFFFGLAIWSGQTTMSIIAVAVCGAALGFLRWNFNPAKIFMGDTGAMFLGFMMAVLGLLLRVPGQSNLGAWMVAILVLGVAVFDTLLVMVSRTRRGLIPFASPGKDHTAHRLANLGLGQRNAVLALYALGVVVGLLALGLSRLALPLGFLILGSVLIAVVIGIIALEHAPYERQKKGQDHPETFEPATLTFPR